MTEWIRRKSSADVPAGNDTIVSVKLRNGYVVVPAPVSSMHWGMDESDYDITDYVVVRDKSETKESA